jgi:hypothetical protein
MMTRLAGGEKGAKMRSSPFVIALVALLLSAGCASLAPLPAGTPAQAAAAKGRAVI